ncbi:MAG: hypothetical protein FJ102_26955, partial [Deltaproteobacteria bacterium]|nr:hypothetical protein [Deltaproteobacteria bacterium]
MVIALLGCVLPEGEAVDPVAILDDFGVVHVGDEVVFDAVVSQGDEFAWEFGDGSSGEGT